MNPKECAYFLGPYGENLEILLELIEESIREHMYWRRNLHPHDEIIIKEHIKTHKDFQDTIAKLKQEIKLLTKELKEDVFFHSLRYMGHMNADLSLPAIVGYISAMLYNPNNVTTESSPITTQWEIEVGKQLAEMIGFPTGAAWGHITSGGTVANIEALWVARNLSYYKDAISDAIKNGELPKNSQNLLNNTKSVEEILELREKISKKLYEQKYQNEIGTDWSDLSESYKKKIYKEIDNIVQKYTIGEKGLHGIKEKPCIITSQTAHYSLKKACDILGIGKENLILVPVDENWRMDISELKNKIKEIEKDNTKRLIAVVPIFFTTEEGALDNICEIIKLKKEHGFYLHVDAAYGGYLASLQRGLNSLESYLKEGYKGIRLDENHVEYIINQLSALKEVDSITIDPHKMGYVPYQAGAVIFKDKRVRNFIASFAPYIFHEEAKHRFIGQYILEGSKAGATAAAVYISHKVIGLNQDGYGLVLKKTLLGAKKLYDELKGLDTGIIKVIPITEKEPDGNIVCFTFSIEGIDSLRTHNQLVEEVFKNYTQLFGKDIKELKFIISKTDFTYDVYKNSKGIESLLDRMGLNKGIFKEKPENDKEDNKISILRITLMHPWHMEELKNGKDSIDLFIDDFKNLLKTYTPYILITEDENNWFDIIEKTIKEAFPYGYKYERFTNHKEVMDYIDKNDLTNFTAAVIDMQLPIDNKHKKIHTASGIDVVSKIKNKKPELPCIIYTKTSPQNLKNLKTLLEAAGFNESENDGLIYKGAQKPMNTDLFIKSLLNLFNKIKTNIKKLYEKSGT